MKNRKRVCVLYAVIKYAGFVSTLEKCFLKCRHCLIDKTVIECHEILNIKAVGKVYVSCFPGDRKRQGSCEDKGPPPKNGKRPALL
jgi:hypothetical protein